MRHGDVVRVYTPEGATAEGVLTAIHEAPGMSAKVISVNGQKHKLKHAMDADLTETFWTTMKESAPAGWPLAKPAKKKAKKAAPRKRSR